MNVNGKNGKQFVYREMGVKWLVTQLEHTMKGDKHEFKFRVDHIIRSGGMPVPKIGHVTSVMSTEGYEHYAGWSVEEAEEDPYVEREYPLRKGSVIRSSEGVLFSRSSPDMIPITTSPEVEYNEILDAYGDALDRIKKLQRMADKAIERSLERKGEATRLREALKTISEESDDPGARECALDALSAHNNIPIMKHKPTIIGMKGHLLEWATLEKHKYKEVAPCVTSQLKILLDERDRLIKLYGNVDMGHRTLSPFEEETLQSLSNDNGAFMVDVPVDTFINLMYLLIQLELKEKKTSATRTEEEK